ncbi:hypothetical protein RhiirC2_794524 [Rhizophagus irregularis]|uniref:Uncharacterized protein n=1 Tax=Rhizophagus irregularis TaxID=588596 RepID=A0A2N1MDD7_9GLOM|nr:hypothetical protein RhiirC2_794524 [Rhizophagus irregularis]
MANPFLQTHYRRGATDLMPEQIEEIRHLKNKVPTYMIVRDYHMALPAPSIEIQPIPASKKDTNNMGALYEKMVEKSTKIVDEKKKLYSENNLLIP